MGTHQSYTYNRPNVPMKAPSILNIAPILVLLTAGTGSLAPAVDDRTLPVYVTEEEAMDGLEKQLLALPEQSGATIDSMKPIEPLHLKGFVAVGISVNISGSGEQITKFLAGLSSQPFIAIPEVKITTDRRDRRIVRAGITVRQWYAAKEKTASKIKKWNKTANPSRPAIEILEICNATLPEKGAEITQFSVAEGTVTLIGRASSTMVARAYGAKLFASEKLNDHKWSWLLRPVIDPRLKDGTASFRVQGEPKS